MVESGCASEGEAGDDQEGGGVLVEGGVVCGGGCAVVDRGGAVEVGRGSRGGLRVSATIPLLCLPRA